MHTLLGCFIIRVTNNAPSAFTNHWRGQAPPKTTPTAVLWPEIEQWTHSCCSFWNWSWPSWVVTFCCSLDFLSNVALFSLSKLVTVLAKSSPSAGTVPRRVRTSVSTAHILKQQVHQRATLTVEFKYYLHTKFTRRHTMFAFNSVPQCAHEHAWDSLRTTG